MATGPKKDAQRRQRELQARPDETVGAKRSVNLFDLAGARYAFPKKFSHY